MSVSIVPWLVSWPIVGENIHIIHALCRFYVDIQARPVAASFRFDADAVIAHVNVKLEIHLFVRFG